MKILLTGLISLFLVGCSTTLPDFPKPPEIKKFYFLLIEQGVGKCIEADIISYQPFKIANSKEIEVFKCDGLGGFLPVDIKKSINYSEDLFKWTQKVECKIK